MAVAVLCLWLESAKKHYWLDIWDGFFHHTFDSGLWLLAESTAGDENAVTQAAGSMAAGFQGGESPK